MNLREDTTGEKYRVGSELCGTFANILLE